MMDILARISKSLIAGEEEKVGELTDAAITQGVPPKQILDEGLIAAMAVVGDRFKAHEIFLPDVLLAAKAMYAGMDRLRPLLVTQDLPTRGTVVLGSVQGDLHDIGKNLVGIMLKGAGFEVIDLGNDVAPEKFLEAVEQHRVQVIGMSALLTTTMPVMKTVVEMVKEKGLTGRVKVIVGGAPVDADFARRIDADAYGFDAANAVEKVKSLTGVS
ncbi:MAG: corrinoid protein [Phycisphaerales bacterium]|nr:MAG: corrinoid protein [Phycisphaerales bacterium]